jgi:hypothetical protein
MMMQFFQIPTLMDFRILPFFGGACSTFNQIEFMDNPESAKHLISGVSS